MNAQILVTQLGQQMGVADLVLDNNGRAALATAEGLHIELHAVHDGPLLYLMTSMGQLRDERPADLMLQLLRANAAASGPGAPFFAMSRVGHEILLTSALPLDALSAEALGQHVQHLIDRARSEQARFGANALHVN
ncbi:MAG: type III secretion system chaperone [Ramlibacter sp.]